MATDLEPRAASSKLDSFVDKQIHQVQDRIRRLDVLRSVLFLGLIVLTYGLLMALLDISLRASSPSLVDALHLISFVPFLAAVGYFLVQTFIRMSGRINPRFAAKQLEETVPQAKNSVINWLDLKDEKLPTAIRGAVSQKAAKDLKRTDAEKAVNPRGNWLMFSLLAALVIGFLILLVTRPNQFGSLLQRAYAPFRDFQLGTSTRITLVQPVKGNLVVPPDRSVEIRARISGNYPGLNQKGAPSLLFRYQKTDPFVTIPLDQDGDGTWVTVRKPEQVGTGFFYKVVAGDAETDEFEISARTDPQPLRFDVTYKHRPYRRLREETVTVPGKEHLKLQGWRGTEVTLAVHANRKLKAGHVTLDTSGERHQFDGQVIEKDETGFRVSWTMEKSGTLRVFFTTTEDESNSSAQLYSVIVEDDRIPQVVLTEPGKDITLPANGTLQVVGQATDDLGIRGMTLQMKVIATETTVVKGKPFREGKDFRFSDGSYPDRVDYRDFVALNSLRSVDDAAVPLTAGMVLEYWLEARDNADYPHKEGNLGVSKTYRVRIAAPTKDEKKEQEERDKAAQGQKEFEKKQDEKHSKENGDRSESGKSGDPKSGGASDKEANELKKKGEELARKIEQERKDQSPGESKGDEGASTDSKTGDTSKESTTPKSKDGKGEPKDKSSTKGTEGKTGAGEPRDKGEKEKGEASAGKSRDAGKSPPDSSAKGADAKEAGKDEKGSSKPGSETAGMKDRAGETKDAGGKMSDDTSSARAGEAPPREDTSSKSGETGKDGSGPSAKGKSGNKDGSGPPTAGKEPPKKGPETAAKEKGSGPGKVDPSTAKPGEHTRKDAASTTKGSDEPDARSMTKPGGDGKSGTEPTTATKTAKEGPEKIAPSTKEGKATDKSGDPGVARGDGRADERKKRKDATAEDLAKLRDRLKDIKQAEDAARELSRIAEKDQDDRIKKEATDILKEDGREAGTPGKTKAAKDEKIDRNDTGIAKAKGSGDPKLKELPPSETRDGKHQNDDSSAKGVPAKKDGDPRKELDPRETHGTAKTGKRDSDATGQDDADQKAIEAVQDFLKRGGDLQLEDLARYLKKVDGDALKRSGWSREELDRWLKAAARHDERLAHDRKHQVDRKKEVVKGKTGTLPGFGPTSIGSSASPTSDPLSGFRAEPPPEFREATNIFRGGGKK